MNKICEKYCQLMQSKFSSIVEAIIFYGSNIYNVSSSDLDVCLIVKEIPEEVRKQIIKETINFHRENNLKIDEEIPHTNKLIYTWAEVNEALTNSPFYVDGKVYIEDIEKTPTFLASKAMKQRLLINILTTDHLVVGKNLKEEEQKAFALIMEVIKKYYNLENPSYETILNCLYQNQYTKAEGEMYLGYKKNNPAKEQYLIRKIKGYLNND